MHRAGRQRLLPGHRPLGGADEDLDHVADELLVEPHARAVGAAEEEGERIEREFVERRLAGDAQAQADRRLDAAPLRHSQRQHGGGRADVIRADQLERQQMHRMGGAEFAIGLVFRAEQAAQLGAGRQHHAVGGGADAGIGLEAHHRHRRGGRQIVRVDHLQQRLREGRELRLHLHLHARGQEREPFQQPFDIGVRDLDIAEPEASPRPWGTRRRTRRPCRA